MNEARDLIFEANEHTVIRSELVRVLAPYLSEEILIEILTMTQKSSDILSKPSILKAIVPYLSPIHLPQVLAIAKAILSDASRAQALYLIAEFLPLELKEDAIVAALSAARSDTDLRASSLSSVVPLLPHQQQAEVTNEAISALEKDLEYKYPGRYLMPMIIAINNLSEQAQEKLIEALIERTGQIGFGTFDRLIMAWEKTTLSDPSYKRKFWCLILRRQCKWMDRSKLLWGLSSLAPILVQMCHPADINYIVQSIASVGEQWP